jgi:hypothetical protein
MAPGVLSTGMSVSNKALQIWERRKNSGKMYDQRRALNWNERLHQGIKNLGKEDANARSEEGSQLK